MRVLYIHMISAFGGSSRSLFEVVQKLSSKEVEPFFVLPAGTAATQFNKITDNIIRAWGISQFDNTRYSYYRGLRWFVLLREFAYLPSTIYALFDARRRWGKFDLIHVNEITGIIPLLLARLIFKAPIVVHVRSLVRNDNHSLRTQLMNKILCSKSDAIIAIDDNVKGSLCPDFRVQVIHNSFATKSCVMDSRITSVLGQMRHDSFKVGFVGNLLRVKGLFDLVEAANILKLERLNIEYLIVGDNSSNKHNFIYTMAKMFGLSQDIKEELLEKISSYELGEKFYFTGFTNEIQAAYKKMDVLCFPSHFDAPGRPIFEAAFSGVPSIASVTEPCADTILDGDTCIAIPPRDPIRLAEAIRKLALNRELTRSMGQKSRELAYQNFDLDKNAMQLLNIYRNCIAKSY